MTTDRDLGLTSSDLSASSINCQNETPSIQHASPLSFSSGTDPDVSVIIPLHSEMFPAKHVLDRQLASTDCLSFEILNISDATQDVASTDREHTDNYIQPHFDTQNFDLVYAFNQAANAARGKYLVFLEQCNTSHR